MSDLENKKNPVVITIARDFGAEGHEIGRMLADELGIPLYDNELLVRASLRAGESLDKMAACPITCCATTPTTLPCW